MKKSTFEYCEDVISKAMMFAILAHSGQQRKGSRTPAIIHAMEAATIASTLTEDNDVIAAALLHDTIEDTDVTSEQILKMFGAKIAALVASETEDKHDEMPAEESWTIRKEESISKLKASDDKGTQGDGSVVLTRRSIYNTREPSPCVYLVFKNKPWILLLVFFFSDFNMLL